MSDETHSLPSPATATQTASTQSNIEDSKAGGKQHYLLALRLNTPPRTSAVIDYTGVDWQGIHKALGKAMYIDDYELEMRIPDDAIDDDVISRRLKGIIDGPADCRDFARVLTSVISDEDDLPEKIIGIRDIWGFLHVHNDRRCGSSPALMPIIMTGEENQLIAFLQDTGHRFRIDFDKQLHTRSRKKKARLYTGTLPDELKDALETEFGCVLRATCRFAPWAMLADEYEKPKRWGRGKRAKKRASV